MDDLSKKRFTQLAGKIALELQQFREAEQQLLGAGIALQALLSAYLDTYERANGTSPETKRLRDELSATWQIMLDPQLFPAIEAARMHFDDIASDVAKVAGALP